MKRSLRLEGNRVEAMVEEFSRHFGGFDAWPVRSQAQFAWSSEFILQGGITLIRSSHRAPCILRATEQTQPQLSIVLPRRGIKEVHFGKSSHLVQPGQILFTKTTDPSAVTLHGEPTELEGLLLDWHQVERAAAALFEWPRMQRLDLTPVVDADTTVGKLITQLSQCFFYGMDGSAGVELSPIVMSNLSEAMIDCILRCIPHNYSHLLSRPSASISPRHVRRAIDFIHANLHLPITIRQVAETVGVSVRSLENGFNTFKQMPPAAYIRMKRLQGARADLMDPKNSLPIRDICIQWGFLHFGRFAGFYLQAFGEKPSETRRRAHSHR